MSEEKKNNSFIPLSRPTIEKDEIREVVDTLKSGWLTTGPKVIKFEEKFKEYVGSKFAIAVNSGTAALHLAYMACGIKDGDEVITTPLTFASTVNMLEVIGAKAVFVDINQDTFNIDVEKMEEKITSKTKAIIPVHFAGRPCEMDRILEIAKKHKLLVIEDAAHAVGTEYKNRRIGAGSSQAVCFSFHPIKNITTGEGGMVTTNNEELADKIRLLRFHGISKEAWKRYQKGASPLYEILVPGYKYNMMDIQAAIGLAQLKKLDYFIKIRTKLAKEYNEAFRNMAGIIHASMGGDNFRHAWHLYIVMFKTEYLKISREEIMLELQKRNIGCGIHFIAIHLHPYYKKKYGYRRGDLPKAEYVSDRIVSLPLFPKLQTADLRRVIESVREILENYKK